MNTIKQIYKTFCQKGTKAKTLVLVAMFVLFSFAMSKEARACCTCCLPTQHLNYHSDTVSNVMSATADAFQALAEILYANQGPSLAPADSPVTIWHHMYLPQLQLFALQMSTQILSFPATIGAMLDADSMQEKILRQQRLTIEAISEQVPSVTMCKYASLTKSLMATERVQLETTRAISIQNQKRLTSHIELAGSENDEVDSTGRYFWFQQRYCNNIPNGGDHGGLLSSFCDATAQNRRINADINFTQTLGLPKTIHTTLYSTVPVAYGPFESREQLQNIVALSRNLYGNSSIPPMAAEDLQSDNANDAKKYNLLYKRSLQAKRSAAQHSFANYVGLKAATDKPDGTEMEVIPSFANLLIELGVDNPNEYFSNGTETMSTPTGNTTLAVSSPSYWAQMEILTKTLYQDPSFYANLYDNPANVRRQQAALKAIELMQERDIHDTSLRTENLLALWLSSELDDYGSDIVREWSNMGQ